MIENTHKNSTDFYGVLAMKLFFSNCTTIYIDETLSKYLLVKSKDMAGN